MELAGNRQWRGGIKIGTMIVGKPVEVIEGIANRMIGMVEEEGTKRRTGVEIAAGKGTTETGKGTGIERGTGTEIRMEIETGMVVEDVLGAIVVNEKTAGEIETREAGRRYDCIFKNARFVYIEIYVVVTKCPDRPSW